MKRRLKTVIGALMAGAALAGPPSGGAQAQVPERLDSLLNRFYAIKDTHPNAALTILAVAARSYPNDIRVQLETGYLAIKLGDKPRALVAFRAAQKIEPARADIARQIGYIENDLQNYPAALEAFLEAQRLEPGNEQVSMQIGYLHDRLGYKRAAARDFRSVVRSADPKLAAQACDAFVNLREVPDRVLPKPWFAEYYMAPEYRSHYGLGVIPFEGRAGLSFGETTVFEPYASVRLTYDTRSGRRGIFGPQIYYDNAAVLALGARFKPHTDVPVFLFAEGGAAYDLVSRDRAPWRSDFRAGLVAYKEWNMRPPCPPHADPFPFRLVADVYADAVYYTRYDNFFLYGRFRPGIRVYETLSLSTDVYGLAAATTDSRGIAGNTQYDLGGGIVFRFHELLGLTLRAEGVRVLRPNGKDYTDFRVRLEHTLRF